MSPRMPPGPRRMRMPFGMPPVWSRGESLGALGERESRADLDQGTCMFPTDNVCERFCVYVRRHCGALGENEVDSRGVANLF